MNVKRIMAIAALPTLAAIGLLIPQGLSGQTDGDGVARLSGPPPGAIPAPGAGAASIRAASYQPQIMGDPLMGSPMMAPPMADPGILSYGSDMPPMMTGMPPGAGLAANPASNLFGPQLVFDANLGEGLGYSEEYYRLNALVPWHVVPGQSVMLFDVSAAVTDGGEGSYNAGVAWRNYDPFRNRIFGLNAYLDHDQGVRRSSGYTRAGVGFESLGKYLDIRANGYYVIGDDSELLNDELVGECQFIGHNIQVNRQRTYETAFSGVDLEMGGPVPFLGHHGLNGYVGAYWLNNDIAGDTVGVMARAEAHITESVTANFTYTNDDVLDTNAFVNL